MKNTPVTENHLYQKAYNKGKHAVGKYVVVYALRDRSNRRLVKADPEHRPLNRLGLTVGKKLGGAVQRSRAKRLMREAYRLTVLEDGGRLEYGYILIVAARTRILEAKTPEVRADLCRALRKIGLFDAAPSGSAPDHASGDAQ